MHTITVTFSECVENSVGMQKLGAIAKDGFSLEDLDKAENIFVSKGYKCEMVPLAYTNAEKKTEYKANVLVIRKGAKQDGIGPIDLFAEQFLLDWDKKAKMYGRVVNKHARYNLCYGDESQEPDYENGKGRVIKWDDVPLLAKLRSILPTYFGQKAADLKAEGNHYYDIRKCHIGFHGDLERRRVIAVRLGATFPLHFQWYHKDKPVGERTTLELEHGDMYIMDQKATGNDWKLKNTPTLRHAAGFEKVLKLK